MQKGGAGTARQEDPGESVIWGSGPGQTDRTVLPCARPLLSLHGTVRWVLSSPLYLWGTKAHRSGNVPQGHTAQEWPCWGPT